MRNKTNIILVGAILIILVTLISPKILDLTGNVVSGNYDGWTSTGGSEFRTRYVNTKAVTFDYTQFTNVGIHGNIKVSTSDNILSDGDFLYTLTNDGEVKKIAFDTGSNFGTYDLDADRISIANDKLYATNIKNLKVVDLTTGNIDNENVDFIFSQTGKSLDCGWESCKDWWRNTYIKGQEVDPIIVNGKVFLQAYSDYRDGYCNNGLCRKTAWGNPDYGFSSFSDTTLENVYNKVEIGKLNSMSKVDSSSGDYVVIGIGNNLYYFDGDTDPTTEPLGCEIKSQIAVKGRNLFFVCGEKIIHYDASSNEIAKQKLLSSIDTSFNAINNKKSFAITDDKIFLGVGGNLVTMDQQGGVFLGMDSTPDVSSGAEITVITAVKDAVYVGTDTGKVIAYDYDLNKLWETSISSESVDTIMIPFEDAMMALSGNKLYLFDTLITQPPPPSPICTEDDGGKNYYVKGTVTLTLEGEITQEITDNCSNDNVLVEAFCVNISGYSPHSLDSYTCPNGCQDGACLPDPTQNQSYCGDGIIDSGEECDGGANCNPDCTFTDSCDDSGHREEVGNIVYYCSPIDDRLHEVKSIDSDCNRDYECEDNICGEDDECLSYDDLLDEVCDLEPSSDWKRSNILFYNTFC